MTTTSFSLTGSHISVEQVRQDHDEGGERRPAAVRSRGWIGEAEEDGHDEAAVEPGQGGVHDELRKRHGNRW